MVRIDKSRWERKRLKIGQLRPHPDQVALYDGSTSVAEDKCFAKDLDERGQLDEIHVMPDVNCAGLPKGTVLDGWRRATSLKAKGHRVLDAYIRHDLADATYKEIQAEFVRFNLGRRQLSPLSRARCAQFLLTAQSCGRKLSGKGLEELKQRIGEQFGVGLRTVNRYLAILDSPVAVQRAYDRGEVSQVHAAKIGTLCSAYYGKLSKRQQEEMARRISEGEPAAKVVHEYITACQGPSAQAVSEESQAAPAGDALMRLDQAICELDKIGSAICAEVLAGRKKTLTKAKMIVERLLGRLQVGISR